MEFKIDILRAKHSLLLLSALCFFLFVLNGGEKNYILYTSTTSSQYSSIAEENSTDEKNNNQKSYNEYSNICQTSISQVIHFFFVLKFNPEFLDTTHQVQKLKLLRFIRMSGNFLDTLFHKLIPANAP